MRARTLYAAICSVHFFFAQKRGWTPIPGGRGARRNGVRVARGAWRGPDTVIRVYPCALWRPRAHSAAPRGCARRGPWNRFKVTARGISKSEYLWPSASRVRDVCTIFARSSEGRRDQIDGRRAVRSPLTLSQSHAVMQLAGATLRHVRGRRSRDPYSNPGTGPIIKLKRIF